MFDGWNQWTNETNLNALQVLHFKCTSLKFTFLSKLSGTEIELQMPFGFNINTIGKPSAWIQNY